jgi:hypothetical protein
VRLVRDGVPASVLASLREKNIRAADHPILLDGSFEADADPYFALALVSGFILFFGLLYAVMAATMLRRSPLA